MDFIYPDFNFITTIKTIIIIIIITVCIISVIRYYSPNEHTWFSSLLYILLELLHRKRNVKLALRITDSVWRIP